MAADTGSESVAAVHNVAGIVAGFADLDGHHAATLAALEGSLEKATEGLNENGFDDNGGTATLLFGHNGVVFLFNNIWLNTGDDTIHHGTYVYEDHAICTVSRLGLGPGNFKTEFTGSPIHGATAWGDVAEQVLQLITDTRFCPLSVTRRRRMPRTEHQPPRNDMHAVCDEHPPDKVSLLPQVDWTVFWGSHRRGRRAPRMQAPPPRVRTVPNLGVV